MLARMRRKGNTLAPLVGMQTGVATVKNSMTIPQETKNKTTLQSSNCTIRYLLKGYKNTKRKRFEGVHAPQCLQKHYQQ